MMAGEKSLNENGLMKEAMWYLMLWSMMEVFFLWAVRDYTLSPEHIRTVYGGLMTRFQADIFAETMRSITFKIIFLIPAAFIIRIGLTSFVMHGFLMAFGRLTAFKTVFNIVSRAFGIIVLRDAVRTIIVLAAGSAENPFVRIPLSAGVFMRSNAPDMLSDFAAGFNVFEVLWLITVLYLLNGFRHRPGKDLWIPAVLTRVAVILLIWSLGVFYEYYFM